MTTLKGLLSRAYAWVRARAAENSTRAGVGAFLAALAVGASSLGSPSTALALVGGAAVAGLAAAIKADPNLGQVARQAVAAERALGPIVVMGAAAALPAHAAAIVAAEAELRIVADAVVPAAEAGAKSAA